MRIVKNKNVGLCDEMGMDDGSGIIINSSTSENHIFNQTAWSIWKLLDSEEDRDKLQQNFLELFNVDQSAYEDITGDFDNVINKLCEINLIDIDINSKEKDDEQ